MGRFLPATVGLLAVLFITVVSGQQESAASAIGRCTNDVRNKFAALNCPDANSATCFCKNPTFTTAISECSQAEGATFAMIEGYLSGGFCQNVEYVKPASSAASNAPGASSQSLPLSTPLPSSTNAQVASTSSASSVQSSTTSTSNVASSHSASIATSSTTTAATATGPAASSTTGMVAPGASDTSASSSSTAMDTAATATPPSDASTSKPNGLSQAAIAGIGVGIGAAVIAMAGIAICMFLRSRKNSRNNRNPDNMEISKPLPGSGRMYATRDDNFRGGRDASFEKYGHEIELTSHRYEDMIPRTQPRTLV